MARIPFQSSWGSSLLSLFLSIPLFACSSSRTSDDAATGGSPNVGGNGGHTTMKGGATGSGGIASAGGGQGSGGAAADGGPGAGGAVTTGGIVSAGGATALGGKTGLGGSPATGGAVVSGGAIGTGGASSTGGTTGVDGGTTGEYGFTYSKPGSNQVSCTGPSATLKDDVADADWLCTFHIGGKTAYVYAQADATGGQCMMSLVPVFGKVTAQISVDGVVSTLSNAKYDAGGNHRNDSLQFDYQDKTYKYYHSSFGFGWRVCQPMDCMNIYKQGTTTAETEGCSSARTLPEVCVPIKADGTHAPLVDTFKKCPGDTGT